MTDNLPPLPDLPPPEVEEWSESFITFCGEGWKRETVEKYAVDYAHASLEASRAAVPTGMVLSEARALVIDTDFGKDSFEVEPADYFCIALIEGAHNDLNPEP